VRPERFELPAFWFVARRSIQLSYGRISLTLTLAIRRLAATPTLPFRFPPPADSIQLSYGRNLFLTVSNSLQQVPRFLQPRLSGRSKVELLIPCLLIFGLAGAR
jgi:hypothetical protein